HWAAQQQRGEGAADRASRFSPPRIRVREVNLRVHDPDQGPSPPRPPRAVPVGHPHSLRKAPVDRPPRCIRESVATSCNQRRQGAETASIPPTASDLPSKKRDTTGSTFGW